MSLHSGSILAPRKVHVLFDFVCVVCDFCLCRIQVILSSDSISFPSRLSFLKTLASGKSHSPNCLTVLLRFADSGNTLATWCQELTHLKRPWCWERLRAGEGDDRGWDGWMASLTQWTWVWVDSGSWWWTGSSRDGTGVRFMGSQRVGHDWATELLLHGYYLEDFCCCCFLLKCNILDVPINCHQIVIRYILSLRW